MKPVNHKLTQEELEQELLDCRYKSEQKDIFITSVVHDMKNLMVPILSRAEMLQLNISEEKRQLLLSQLNKNCYTLMDALQKMVAICKDRNKTTDVFPTHFNVRNLVIEVLDALEEEYLTKKIDAQNLIDSDVMVYADRQMLLSVFMNLIGNAIKFTNQRGKIEVLSEALEPETWRISIKDNGIGIDEKKMFNLIKKNQYYTTPGTMGESGTGLGLMLCVSKLQRNNSLLEARNNPDQGASFSFCLTNKENNINED